MSKEVKVPKISEDADSGTVAEIYVKEGDTIEEGDDIVALESDKASVDVPSDASGKVKSIEVKEGDEVKVGDVLLVLEEDAQQPEEEEKDEDASEKKDRKADKEEKEDEKDDQKEEITEEVEEQEEKETQAKEDKEPKKEEEDAKSKEAKDSKSSTTRQGEEDSEKEEREIEDERGADSEGAPSAPLAKKFARELGIDIKDIKGGDERITREDVMAYAKKIIQSASGGEKPASGIELPDFSRWGKTEREALNNIRSAMARNTSQSWKNIPHVTHHDNADLTELHEFLSKMEEEKEEKLSMTAVITKIAGEALMQFPKFNASLDFEKNEIVYKKYFHISMAVDTESGLYMPVIRDVDKKSIAEISSEVKELAEKARNKKLKAEEMKGGNFAISNLGGIGGTSFTPIIFPPQGAILGVSTAEVQAVWSGEKFEPRKILPLSLSYDHRLIDGAEAARFLRWICEVVEQPFNLLTKS